MHIMAWYIVDCAPPRDLRTYYRCTCSTCRGHIGNCVWAFSASWQNKVDANNPGSIARNKLKFGISWLFENMWKGYVILTCNAALLQATSFHLKVGRCHVVWLPIKFLESTAKTPIGTTLSSEEARSSTRRTCTSRDHAFYWSRLPT
jgi:hypothetical protein